MRDPLLVATELPLQHPPTGSADLRCPRGITGQDAACLVHVTDRRSRPARSPARCTPAGKVLSFLFIAEAYWGRERHLLELVTFLDAPDGLGPEGVLFAQGSDTGGHTLYVKDGTLNYVYNWLGEVQQKLSANEPLTPGRHTLSVSFDVRDRDKTQSPHGPARLFIDGKEVASQDIKTQPGFFGLEGVITVGRDTGRPASGGLAEAVRTPTFATAVGLVQYGAHRQGMTTAVITPPRKGIFDRVRRMLSSTF